MDALEILALGLAAKGGGGGGTSDYSDLSNKPQINSVTLSGNKSLEDLGIPNYVAGDNIDITNGVIDVNPDGILFGIDPEDPPEEGGSWGYYSSGSFGQGIISVQYDEQENPIAYVKSVDIIENGIEMADMDITNYSKINEASYSDQGISIENGELTSGGSEHFNFSVNDAGDKSITLGWSETDGQDQDSSEIVLTTDDNKLLVNNSAVALVSDIPAAELPAIESGDAGKVLKVNSGETGVEWGAGGGGSSYTFTNGLTESSGTVSWDLNNNVKAYTTNNGEIVSNSNGSTAIGFSNHGHIVSSSSSAGSLVFGACYDNGYIQSTGRASIAGGQSVGKNITVSSAIGSIAFGCADSTYGDISTSSDGQVALGLGVQASPMSPGQVVIGKCNSNINQTDKALIIGNGTNNSNRSNALTVDWSGNLVCNNIPAPPAGDGSYNLQCTISSGTPTYSWVAIQYYNGGVS